MKADRLTAWCAAGLLIGTLSAVADTAMPPPFEGHYEIWRNGSQIGEATTSQVALGGDWQLENHSEGTRGSARLLGFSEHTTSSGRWHRGLPLVERYNMKVHTVVKEFGWSAVFDWTNGEDSGGVVTLDNGEEPVDWEVSATTLDPLSAGLRIRIGLMRGEDHWTFPLVDEDEVDTDEFRAFDEERLDTDLGCLVTRRVEKVRAPDSKRYTRTWYAKDLGWAPVKVEHGKTGGTHMETHILTLTVDGQPVISTAPCAPASD